MDTPVRELFLEEPGTPAQDTRATSHQDGVAERSIPRADGDAIYRLESPARCPQCGEVLSELRAVRLLRVEVNFTSMLPRRGRIVVCPYCQTIVPAELTNL
jgi:hypothetical protein